MNKRKMDNLKYVDDQLNKLIRKQNLEAVVRDKNNCHLCDSYGGNLCDICKQKFCKVHLSYERDRDILVCVNCRN